MFSAKISSPSSQLLVLLVSRQKSNLSLFNLISISFVRWHDIWTYLKKFRNNVDGTWNHVHSVSRRFVFKDAEMFNSSTDSFINYQCYWRFRLKSIKENCNKVSEANNESLNQKFATLIQPWKANLRNTTLIYSSSSRSIIYYFTTTVCAVILGIILVSVIRPGDGNTANLKNTQKVTRDVLTADTLLDLVR